MIPALAITPPTNTITDDDGKRGSGQPAPHVTQQGADTPGHRASEAAGNVADPHCTPIRHHRGAEPSSSAFLASSLRIGSRFLLDGRPVVITAIGPDRRTKVSFNYRRLDIVDRHAGCAPGYTNDWGRAELANDAVVEVCE